MLSSRFLCNPEEPFQATRTLHSRSFVMKKFNRSAFFILCLPSSFISGIPAPGLTGEGKSMVEFEAMPAKVDDFLVYDNPTTSFFLRKGDSFVEKKNFEDSFHPRSNSEDATHESEDATHKSEDVTHKSNDEFKESTNLKTNVELPSSTAVNKEVPPKKAGVMKKTWKSINDWFHTIPSTIARFLRGLKAYFNPCKLEKAEAVKSNDGKQAEVVKDKPTPKVEYPSSNVPPENLNGKIHPEPQNPLQVEEKVQRKVDTPEAKTT